MQVVLRAVLNAMALVLIAGPAVAQEPPRARLAPSGDLYDAAGKRIGPFDPYIEVEGGSGSRVLARFGDVVAYVSVGALRVSDSNGRTWTDPSRLVPAGPIGGLFSSGLLFETPDCTGPAFIASYVAFSQLGALPSITLPDGNGGGTLHIAASVEPQDRIIRGTRSSTTDCRDDVAGQLVRSVPVTQSLDLASRFKSPYSLR